MFFKNLFMMIKQALFRLKIGFMFQFRLKPKIMKMKNFVGKIVNIRKELFPIGKSLFIFPGKEDTLYFIVFKEDSFISIMEVYDEILNRIPERYQILPKIRFNDVFAAT